MALFLSLQVIMIILIKVSSGLSLTCQQAEYQIGNECCPKCPTGSRVKTHCNEYRSTSCLPCMDGTFTDQPNGLERCIPCTNCDSALGLMVKKRCTATSDTICAPLEGFYCVSSVGLSCDTAQKHKCCKPGQYISQKGTASTDTECSDCSSGTFSNGTFYSCQQHTQCHSLNLHDFLLDLYSDVKDCETKTGLSVLPSLESVFQSAPAVWSIKLSERKTSILLEVLKLQPEKKQVELKVGMIHGRKNKSGSTDSFIIPCSSDPALLIVIPLPKNTFNNKVFCASY
uniref:TNFR-Cys domain-containing protein n=1 Tax=Neolamprologus brichardi TaxID=32507 RepID=A0A3Q4H664_NEOBR